MNLCEFPSSLSIQNSATPFNFVIPTPSVRFPLPIPDSRLPTPDSPLPIPHSH
ncbi:hypothetical protein [Moorena sp. SIO3H5]|uniref:hypothetical protein n=1 Tax=Moorena sp. SIO3H5 TaxID=2607834 RepID=UPI0013BCD993|nr:hypothetical protein [Moorena sp. SIO3H5]NEO72709.1 hypothetical protein [Moorena sp. SIO3H5]